MPNWPANHPASADGTHRFAQGAAAERAIRYAAFELPLRSDRTMKTIVIATALVLAACSTADEVSAPAFDARPVTAEVSAPDGCLTRLTATPAHPFLAEFARQLSVTCNGAQTNLELQLDPGRLGRVELVLTDEGLLVVTDAFQSTTVRTSDSTLLEVGLHAGKLDRYTTPCATTQVFRRAQGTFLGAFDYCNHRWQFLRPT